MLTHELTSRTALLNGIEIAWKESGTGTPVILLHGFPEFWYAWRHQIEPLAAAGHRVICPDLRGYGESAKPAAIVDYRIDALVGDVVALIEHVGAPVSLVGHDWGGVIAWRVGRTRPDLLRHLVILNVPHPAAIARAMRSPLQLARFWYQFALQPPWLGETALRAGNFALLRAVLRRSAKRAVIDDETMERYVEAWRRPGAIAGMVNYYRALFRHRPDAGVAGAGLAALPTMLIFGVHDPVFTTKSAKESVEFVPALRLELVQEAGHFVEWDAAERVNELLLEFIG